MNIKREGLSDFLDNLVIEDTGEVRIANTTGNFGLYDDIHTVKQAQSFIEKIKKCAAVEKGILESHLQQLQKGTSPHAVVQSVAGHLDRVKQAEKISLKIAKTFRQIGMFKIAEKKVYQDLETGDFWKISDDGRSVLRLFKEQDNITDKIQ